MTDKPAEKTTKAPAAAAAGAVDLGLGASAGSGAAKGSEGDDQGLSLPHFDAESLLAGHRLFAGEIEFIMGAAGLEQLPKADRVEISFAGRSNVGKSSLINALTGRKALARTSNTPGRTQQLNYFRMGDGVGLPLYLVDLPGYGYAKIERAKVEAWTGLVKNYLVGRPNLRRILLLIDGRHGLKANDEEIMTMLDKAAVNYQIILTKCDKLSKGERAKIKAATFERSKKRPACHPEIFETSSEKGWGIPELRANLALLARL